ncbi:MAG TPA: type II secretion system protein [Phycisphaerae bacterium]|nr:type II secretion system protein [Phycisphaerae bacterium]
MLRLRSDMFPGIGQSASLPAARRGFTLIEVMVVIAILVVLMALLVAVGSGVISNSKARQTHATLHTLDGVMKQYLDDGNPEPQPPDSTTWTTLYGAHPPQAYAQTQTKDPTTGTLDTAPDSDPINYVKLFRADPKIASELSTLKMSQDISTSPNGPNMVILDAWGTPIRYVPYNATTKKNGYFESAGPDGVFLTTVDPPVTGHTPPPDDLYSTDPL